ncbi:hypothetical protein CEE69_07790 [Rhodopirellula bahusiensis]|uniref:Uncharacterized protein n=1 Tax=Rhodopirellula bahusiensis TaxID=2014065 RepID=A0A2G1W948_9BACT|nr:hypothetical protein CEE69_07790 [Rhodopirellula bahusiensis]
MDRCAHLPRGSNRAVLKLSSFESGVEFEGHFESVQSDVESVVLGNARTLPRQGRRQHWCEERAFNHQRGSGDFCASPIASSATAL